MLHYITPAFFFSNIKKNKFQGDAGELELERELGSELGDPTPGYQQQEMLSLGSESPGCAGAEEFSAHSTSAPSSPLIRTHQTQLDGLRVVSAILLHKQKTHKNHHFLCKLPLPLWNFFMRFQALSLDEDLLPQKI